jgi:hypothetical protein
MRGAGAGVPRSAAPGDAAPAPRSSSTMGPGISGLYLRGSPSSLPLPINLRWVWDEVESECLQVIVVERLLHETLASVHRNILRLIRVSLKREAKSCSHSNGFLHTLSFLPCSISATLVSGQRGCACDAGGGDLGAGGRHHCGGRLCHDNAYCIDFCPGSCCGMGHRHPPC